MFKQKFFNTLFAAMVGLLLLTAGACDPGGGGGGGGGSTSCVSNSSRLQGRDEFKIWQNIVYEGPASVSPLPQATCSDWNPVAAGDALSVDSSGEAELNFSACWSGRIFIFRDSGGTFRTAACRKAEYPSAGDCVLNGTWYTGSCAGEYTLNTPSARITKIGTSYSVTYLEEFGLTLVAVMEGEAGVAPVTRYDPTNLEAPIPVRHAEFLFTMPDDQLREIGGLPPRTPHPVELLPAVVNELGIHQWMRDAAGRASEENVLPPAWPAELGGQGVVAPPQPGNAFSVRADGGLLTDPQAQRTLLSAIDWRAMPADENGAPAQVTAIIGGESFDAVQSLSYDPAAAAVYFKEAQPRGLVVLLFYPAEDPGLEGVAGRIVEYLIQIGVHAEIRSVSADELLDQLKIHASAGEPVMALTR